MSGPGKSSSQKLKRSSSPRAGKPLSDIGWLAGLGPAQVWGLGQVRHILLAQFTDGLPPSLHPPDGRLYLPPADVVELSQVEQHADATDGKHKDQKHSLFCGTWYVTLDFLHAGITIALKHPRNVEAIQEVLACQEAYLQRIAEHHLDDVETGNAFLPPDFGTLVSWRQPPGSIGDFLYLQAVVVFFTAVRMHQNTIDVARMDLSSVMVVMATVVTMTMVIHVRMQEGVASVTRFGGLVNGIRDEAQAWCAHQDDLEDPVADVRDGKGLVVAGLVAAGLHGVTDEHDLLVLVHLLAHYADYEDAEDHHHCQQDPGEETETENNDGA